MSTRRAVPRRAVTIAAFFCACVCAASLHARELIVTVGKLAAPNVSAQNLRLLLSGRELDALTLEAGALSVVGRAPLKAKLTCAKLDLTAERIACASGAVDVGQSIPVSFSYLTQRRELVVKAKPGGAEAWSLSGQLWPTRLLNLEVKDARLQRLTPVLPSDAPRITAGVINGTVAARGETLNARLELSGLAFADPSGLHAGEKITAAVEADADRASGAWRWKTRATWKAGEVFWQPVFMAARGQRIEAQGTTASGVTTVRDGRLDLPEIGAATFSGRWDHTKGEATAVEAHAKRLNVAVLYEQILKPLLQGTALADLRVEGQVSFAARRSAAALESFDLELAGVSLDDREQRFAVFGLAGRVPWRRDQASAGELSVKSAELYKLPIGALRVPLRTEARRVSVARAEVPVLDGKLTLTDLAAARAKDGWRWRITGELTPVSMAQLTQALGLPVMHGVLAGDFPELRYRRGEITMDGTLGLRLFDGVVRAEKVKLIDAFGRAPRLHADIDLQGIDLELLTRTFDFGTITGRADAHVRGLELVDWQPVRFDARIESSAGTYPRKISQRAVQNISALGGAGAAAAIQRSFLRFFDQFGYDRLGLSCKLQNGVCQMDGIERAPQGYVIVKGGGIPAISVIGYNRAVDWRELVERLKRITQENVKPIVK